MIGRLGMALGSAFGSAAVLVGVGLTGLAGPFTGTASAAPGCADFHWIGAAGSGQRDAVGMTANAGMGGVVYQSYQQLRSELLASGKTITAEAVRYPAAPVPVDGGLGGWIDFMDSVEEGTDATAEQFEAFTEQCPNTKVVLAGYSQGAMVVHRNLYDLADDPHVAAALLIADGDRLPADTTVNMGTAAFMPLAGKGVGKGIAQEHSFLASTNTSPLPPSIGAQTISVCDTGDTVCDYDATAPEVPGAGIAIHTAYAPAASGVHGWGTPLYNLVMSSAPAPTATIDTIGVTADGA